MFSVTVTPCFYFSTFLLSFSITSASVVAFGLHARVLHITQALVFACFTPSCISFLKLFLFAPILVFAKRISTHVAALLLLKHWSISYCCVCTNIISGKDQANWLGRFCLLACLERLQAHVRCLRLQLSLLSLSCINDHHAYMYTVLYITYLSITIEAKH